VVLIRVFDALYFGGGITFSILLFLTIFGALEVLIRGGQVLFGHQKQWNLPLGFG